MDLNSRSWWAWF